MESLFAHTRKWMKKIYLMNLFRQRFVFFVRERKRERQRDLEKKKQQRTSDREKTNGKEREKIPLWSVSYIMRVWLKIRLSAFLVLPHFDARLPLYALFAAIQEYASSVWNDKSYTVSCLHTKHRIHTHILCTSAFTSTSQLGRTLCVFRELYGRPFGRQLRAINY